MFRLIRRLIGFIILAAIVFMALALWQGGSPFRWFGKKSEQAAEVVKNKSEEAAEKADEIKKKTDEFKSTTKKVGDGVKKTEEKIKEISGSKSDKE
jgi:hypothetical protein